MEVGPFSIADIEAVKEVFEFNKVSFEMFIDQDAQQAAEDSTSDSHSVTGKLDLKIIYFEIADQDFNKVRPGLERFGAIVHSDGSFELGED